MDRAPGGAEFRPEISKGGERMSYRKRMNREITETIDELWEHGLDASMMRNEIEDIIDHYGPEFDPKRDWQYVGKQLGLL